MVAVQATTKWSFKGANLPIDTVTVYRPSRAQVFGKLDLDLKAENNVIEVIGLSSVTDTESLIGPDSRPNIPEARAAGGKGHWEFTRPHPRSRRRFRRMWRHALEAKIKEIRRRISKTAGDKAGLATMKAVITIVANDDGPAKLKLTYRLYSTPEDEEPSKSVYLHYHVSLQQRTGEDWNDAKLILSTSATDMLDAGVPATDSLTIQPKEKPRPPPPLPPLNSQQRSATSVIGSSTLRARKVGGGPPLARGPITPHQSVRCHKYGCLLPASWNKILVNNSYVFKTDSSETAAGDTLSFTLGMDTSIRASQELTQSFLRSPPSSFVEKYTTTTFVSTAKLHSRHTGGYPVNIVEVEHSDRLSERSSNQSVPEGTDGVGRRN